MREAGRLPRDARYVGDLDVDCTKLMGCAYSCPVVLGEADGDIVLDIETIDEQCESYVEVCASSHGLRVENTCP